MFEPDIPLVNIDPETHPVYLYAYEYKMFESMLNKKVSFLHRHDWTYRLDRPLGDVYILYENQDMTATHLPCGRYCPNCKKVEYVTEEDAKKHTWVRWSQLDFITLGIR